MCVFVPMLSKNLKKDTQNTFYRFYRNMKIEFSNFLLDSYTLPLIIILASNHRRRNFRERSQGRPGPGAGHAKTNSREFTRQVLAHPNHFRELSLGSLGVLEEVM